MVLPGYEIVWHWEYDQWGNRQTPNVLCGPVYHPQSPPGNRSICLAIPIKNNPENNPEKQQTE